MRLVLTATMAAALGCVGCAPEAPARQVDHFGPPRVSHATGFSGGFSATGGSISGSGPTDLSRRTGESLPSAWHGFSGK